MADGLHSKLMGNAILSKVLDGDQLRKGINNNLGFSLADRLENIKRVAEISRLFMEEGFITLNAVVCPLEKMRSMAKSIVGEINYVEIFVDAPLWVCESRDIKGMYQKARSGEIREFTGIDSPFEQPVNADVTIRTDQFSIQESVEYIYTYLVNRMTE